MEHGHADWLAAIQRPGTASLGRRACPTLTISPKAAFSRRIRCHVEVIVTEIRASISRARRVVVKIGLSTLVANEAAAARLASELAAFCTRGYSFVLVTSGAIAIGCNQCDCRGNWRGAGAAAWRVRASGAAGAGVLWVGNGFSVWRHLNLAASRFQPLPRAGEVKGGAMWRRWRAFGGINVIVAATGGELVPLHDPAFVHQARAGAGVYWVGNGFSVWRHPHPRRFASQPLPRAGEVKGGAMWRRWRAFGGSMRLSRRRAGSGCCTIRRSCISAAGAGVLWVGNGFSVWRHPHPRRFACSHLSRERAR